jgi:hypothetical protein
LGLYTILPSEISLQLAEVALDLRIHDRVNLQSRKSGSLFSPGPVLFCESSGFSQSDLFGSRVKIMDHYKTINIKLQLIHRQETHQIVIDTSNNVIEVSIISLLPLIFIIMN